MPCFSLRGLEPNIKYEISHSCHLQCAVLVGRGNTLKKKDTKGEVTNNMTHCILPNLFGEMFNVQTRERASRTPRSTQVLLIATRSRESVSEVSLAVGVGVWSCRAPSHEL